MKYKVLFFLHFIFLGFLSSVHSQEETWNVSVSQTSVSPGDIIEVVVAFDNGLGPTNIPFYKFIPTLTSFTGKEVLAQVVGAPEGLYTAPHFYILIPDLGDSAFTSTLTVTEGPISGKTTVSYNPITSLAIVRADPTITPNGVIVGYNGSNINTIGINIKPNQITGVVFTNASGEVVKTIDTSKMLISVNQISFKVPNLSLFPHGATNAMFAITLQGGSTSNFVPFNFIFGKVDRRSPGAIQITNARLRKVNNRLELVISGNNLDKVNKITLGSGPNSAVFPQLISFNKKDFFYECKRGIERIIVFVNTNIRGYDRVFVSSKDGFNFSNLSKINSRRDLKNTCPPKNNNRSCS